MDQEFIGNQIRYLMIFIKDQPSEGLAAFQKKFIRVATYNSEGTLQPRTFHECIGQDTKTKILVTGMIRLNTRNILTGLKMAFPPMDFDTHTLNIQRFSLIGTTWTQEKEAGVIVAAEQTGHLGEIRWQQPQVYDLQASEVGTLEALIRNEPFAGSDIDEDLAITGFRPKSDPFEDFPDGESLSDLLNEQLDRKISFDDLYKELDENLIKEVFKGEEEEFIKTPLSDHQEDEPTFEIDQESFEKVFNKDIPGVTGFYAETKEIGEAVEERSSIDPFDDNIPSVEFEDLGDVSPEIVRKDVFDTSKERGSAKISAFEDRSSFFEDDEDEFNRGIYAQDDAEGINDWQKLKSSMFISEEEAVEGMEAELPQMHDLPKNVLDEGEETFEEIDGDALKGIPAWILKRMEDLPIQKVSITLIVLGVLVLCLSFAVKIFEPDLDATLKASGIMDVSQWIVKNDLVGVDTDDWFPIWKASPEYSRYWSWYDTYWKPRSDSFRTFRMSLIYLGAIASGLGVVLASGDYLLRNWRLRKEREPVDETSRTSKRISHSFIMETDIWPSIDSWVTENNFKILEVAGSRRLYRKRGGFSHPPIMFFISSNEDEVHFEVWVSTWIPTLLIPMISDLGFDVLEAKGTPLPEYILESINSLLLKFQQEPLP